jgi:5-histidylcysteine sulfoxide synthase/putative 4-mercaptohistidine N1-methyltranferase
MNNLPKQLKTPLLCGTDPEAKRAELKKYFHNTWQTYEALFSLINADEAFYLRPEPLRHPLIFYFGHTATFFVNKLLLGKYITTRINEKLEAICAVGVDEMSWDDLDSSHYDWPTVDEVKQYRQQVFSLVNDLLDEMPLTLPIEQDSMAWVMLMGCEHERIHLETSSVIMRMLSLDHLTSNDSWQQCDLVAQAPENQLLAVNGQQQCLGKQTSDQTYGWDNEYGQLSVNVDDFKASKYLVSNQEYLEFMEEGGYQKPVYWCDEGKQWLAFKKVTMPVFWSQQNGEYFQRNLLNVMPLPMNWPVEVNYLEAKAFCAWKNQQSQGYIRLPTEAEWYCLDQQSTATSGQQSGLLSNTNLDHFCSSSPVDHFSCSDFFDVRGNVWQWTESAIDGFAGFKVHPLYDDFSTPTFDGKHNLIKGGSWISTGNELIGSSRYAFRRHFYQHAGFRYVESPNQQIPTTEVNRFESDVAICQQLEQQYGEKSTELDHYQTQLAGYVRGLLAKFDINNSKLLNLGCSVGRTAFELSTDFNSIDAIDFSARLIQYGVQLQAGKSIRYQSVIEGDIVAFNEVSLASIGIGCAVDNIHFLQGDAVNLKPIFTGYDVIIVQQVLENSYDPKKVLADLHQRLNKQGILIVVSDFCFDQQTTDKVNWLGGIKVNGENVSGFDGLSAKLSPHFTCIETSQLSQMVAINSTNSIVKSLQVSLWQLDE